MVCIADDGPYKGQGLFSVGKELAAEIVKRWNEHAWLQGELTECEWTISNLQCEIDTMYGNSG